MKSFQGGIRGLVKGSTVARSTEYGRILPTHRNGAKRASPTLCSRPWKKLRRVIERKKTKTAKAVVRCRRPAFSLYLARFVNSYPALEFQPQHPLIFLGEFQLQYPFPMADKENQRIADGTDLPSLTPSFVSESLIVPPFSESLKARPLWISIQPLRWTEPP